LHIPEIPGYKIIEPLGEGGMAMVYLAVQENFQRKVAVKVLSERLISDASFCERFLREARIVAQLSHQHIVPVFDVGQQGDCHYIAMELLRGGDLKQRLEDGLPLTDCLDIVCQIASALHYAASKNFVHRDIKPENILFRENGSAVVSDFGIARSTESETNMTLTGTIIGTPSYMSPEQAQATSLDGRSDLYSLGIILFEMLTGNVPYTADSAISIGLKHITDPIPELPDEFSEFQPIIDKIIAKSPDDRYQTGQELIDALLEIEHQLHQSDGATLIISAADMKRHRSTTGRSHVARRSGVGRSSGARARAAEGRSRGEPVGLMSRKAVLAASIAGVIAIGGAGGWWYLENQGEQGGVATNQVFNAKTQALLKQATLALSENRLYEPPNNSAQYYYTTALALAPNNQDAVVGIESLITTYLENAQAALATKNSPKSIEWLNRAAQIGFYAVNQTLMERQQQLRLDVFQLEQQSIRLAESQRQVQQLLEEAGKALTENRLTSPVDDNAYDKFQSVLALDPSNKKAMEGVKTIAANYLGQAKEQAAGKNFVRARALVAAAIQIDSQHPGLASAQQAILDAEEAKRQGELKLAQKEAQSEAKLLRQQEEEKRARARQISSMLAQANDDIENNRLQLPAGDNAVEKFRTVLTMDPSNLQALEGLQNVGEKYVTLASDSLKNNAVSDADTYLNIAQKLVPNSANLLSARRALLAAKENIANARGLAQERESQIYELLNKAARDETEGRRSAPIGNNALEKYAQVLAIDETNQTAKAGRKKIVAVLVIEADDAIGDNDFEKAEATLALLMRHFPEHSKAKSLRSNLQKARERFAKQDKEVSKLLASARRLTKKTASASNNQKLRSNYSKVLKLDPRNQVAVEGLKTMSDREITLAKSAIKSRDYDRAQKWVDSAMRYTPTYRPVRSIKKELDERLRIEGLVKNHINNAEKEFARPNLLSNNDTARQAFKTAYQNIQSAKKLDSAYPQIDAVTSNLEGNYIKAIQYFSEIKAFDRGSTLIDDALAMDIPKNRINKQKQLLEAKKKEEIAKKEKKKRLTRQMGVF
jgi:serine/threonine-protein kinase PpkA